MKEKGIDFDDFRKPYCDRFQTGIDLGMAFIHLTFQTHDRLDGLFQRNLENVTQNQEASNATEGTKNNLNYHLMSLL